MRNSLTKSIIIVLFSVVLAGCGSREPLTEDISAEITMQGVEVDISEDVAVGTLLSRTITINNITVPLTDVAIVLTGTGSEDFNVTLESAGVANTYIGKVVLLHSLEGKGGAFYELNATATADTQSIGPVLVKIHIIDVPKQTIVEMCDDVNGSEPWITDGTALGTKPLANLNPEGSSRLYSVPVRVGSMLYFLLDDGISGTNLWQSDGTTAGTEKVKDFDTTSINERANDLILLGETLFFSVSGHQLWRSDGSEAGTQMIKDINASEISHFTSYHDKLYFIKIDRAESIGLATKTRIAPILGAAALWESDGIAEGTKLVMTLPEGLNKPRGLSVVGDTLYMAIPDYGENALEIKKIDMTQASLSLEDDDTLDNTGLRWMGVYKDKLHLVTFHSGIWVKEAGTYTKLPLDIDFDVGNIQVFNGLFLFNSFRSGEVEDTNRYMQLWDSDTTEEGSHIIKENPCTMESESM